MGIFGAGSGGLLVVATGIVELAFPVLRIIDDSVDLLRNSHFCLLQELRFGRLLLGLWVGMLSIAAPGQFAGNPAVYAALLFLSASGDVVPGRGPNDGFLVMEAAAATLVNGPRFYGHGWPAEPRY